MFLTVFSAVLAAGAVLFFAFSLGFSLLKRRIMRAFIAYFTSPDQETPSQFAVLIDTIAQAIAARLVQQVKSVVMGMNSADAKAEKRGQLELIKQNNPSLAGLASILPKSWVRNPEVLQSIVSVLGPLIGPRTPPDNGQDQEARKMFNL